MEPITLITTAIAMATPYLLKTGETIAEGIGEDLWKLIKKPFIKNNDSQFFIDITHQDEKDKLINLLMEEIDNNSSFKEELERAVLKGKKELDSYHQQNINNNGNIDKQVNIQSNSGDINF